MSSQLSALSSQFAHGQSARRSPRKTDLTQRRKDAKTQSLGWSVPVGSPAPSDSVPSSLVLPARKTQTSRKDRQARKGKEENTPVFLCALCDLCERSCPPSSRSAVDGRSPRQKVGKGGGKLAFRAMRRLYGGPDRGRRTPDTAKRNTFASLRLSAFAFLSYRLPIALCAPLCSQCLCVNSAYWETVWP